VQAAESWSKRAASHGITENEVAEFCRAIDCTPAEFWQQFEPGMVTDAVADSPGKKTG